MPIIDLTHTIYAEMPVFPGAGPPRIEQLATLEADGYREKQFTFNSHLGTHVDVPAHMIASGKTVDEMAAGQFYGTACRYLHNHKHGLEITLAHLLPLQDELIECDFLLLATGWDRLWGTADYQDRYPVLTGEAARWLGRFTMKGVGVDTISVDGADSTNFPIHHCLLRNDTVIVENLKQLTSLPNSRFHFSCLPLPLARGDGSPVRAVALV